MKTKLNNQRGMIDLFVVTVAVLILIGAGVYLYARHLNSGSAYTPPGLGTKATDPYAGWTTYKLKYEGFSFKYPSDFTLSANEASAEGITPGNDNILLTKSDGFTLNINTGATGLGGGCNCSVALSEPINSLGRSLYLNYILDKDLGANMISNVTLATGPTDFFGQIPGKNIKFTSTAGDTSTPPTLIGMTYVENNTSVNKTLSDYQNGPDMPEAKLIIKSMSY